MRCLSILILSYISLVSDVNAKMNPCAAIDKTDVNLSNVVALFVQFRWSAQLDKNRNYTMIETAMIRAFEKEYSRRSSILPEIMENFFKCYGSSGGLQVKRIMFEKNKITDECVLSQEKDLPTQSDFSGKVVRVIETPNYIENCGKKHVGPNTVQDLVSESILAMPLNIALCSEQNSKTGDCEKMKSMGIRVIPVGEKMTFYEILEVYIDNLFSHDTNVTVTSDDVDVKYSYFPSIPRTQLIWPSFVSVLTVITFFLAGLCICCCSLLTFVLVEEDFQKRNDERDWIALNLRRNEQLEANSAVSPTSSNMATAISNASNHSLSKVSKIETAKSNPSSRSSSGSDVFTDCTQASETEPLVPLNPTKRQK